VATVERLSPVAGHAVVALAGDLDITGCGSAGADLTAAVMAGQRLIVDLAALEFIDCSGVRALLGVQRLARQSGCDMLLAAPRPSVLRLMMLLRAADALGICASISTAVLGSGRQRHADGQPLAPPRAPRSPAAPGAG
jgi:anti-sigma B factor antagonist